MGRLATPEERALALGKAFRRTWWPRYLASIALATPVGLTPGIFFAHSADFVVVPAVFLAVALAAQWLFLGRRLRGALEAFSWVARWELLRAQAVADPFPASISQARDLAERGELPRQPGAVDVLVASGDYEAARRLVDELPDGGEWERFERESQRAWVEWVVSGHDTLRHDAEAAAQRLRDPEERLRAEAVLALAEGRERLAAGGDWMDPLVRARKRIGTRADGVLRHDWWRAQVVPTAALALGFAVVYALPT